MCTGEGGATCIKTIIPLILDTVYGVGAMSELTILPSIVSTMEAQVRVDLEKNQVKLLSVYRGTLLAQHLTRKSQMLRGAEHTTN